MIFIKVGHLWLIKFRTFVVDDFHKVRKFAERPSTARLLVKNREFLSKMQFLDVLVKSNPLELRFQKKKNASQKICGSRFIRRQSCILLPFQGDKYHSVMSRIVNKVNLTEKGQFRDP